MSLGISERIIGISARLLRGILRVGDLIAFLILAVRRFFLSGFIRFFFFIGFICIFRNKIIYGIRSFLSLISCSILDRFLLSIFLLSILLLSVLLLSLLLLLGILGNGSVLADPLSLDVAPVLCSPDLYLQVNCGSRHRRL